MMLIPKWGNYPGDGGGGITLVIDKCQSHLVIGACSFGICSSASYASRFHSNKDVRCDIGSRVSSSEHGNSAAFATPVPHYSTFEIQGWSRLSPYSRSSSRKVIVRAKVEAMCAPRCG